MKQTALGLATRVYRATPFRPLRNAYFRAFLRLVRGRRVVKTVEGMTFDLDLSEMIDVGIFLHQYERDVVAVIERLARPGWSVFDIGANIGAHALRFARLVGPSGRVYAFEPMEYAFTKLRRNIALNGDANTHPFNIALSDRDVPRQHVTYRSSWASSGERRAESSVVELRTLDGWCADQRVSHVDLIKLDVDGHELEVLQGGLVTIERCRPIFLIEVGAWHFASPDRNPLELLAARGYRFWETRSLQELDLPGVQRLLPEHDADMAFSFNLVASVDSLAFTPHESEPRA